MTHMLRMLAVFYRTSIQTDIEYRADFFTRIVASVLSMFTTIGALAVAYSYTSNVRGWSFSQALVLIAVYYLMDGLVETFVGPNMRQVMSQVREGTLDFVLVKPVNAQFMATMRTLNIWRAANALIGLGLCGYSTQRLAIQVGPREALLFVAAVAAAVAIVYSLWLVLVTLTFWFVRIDNLEQVMWQAFEAGRYPIEIYPPWLRGALTYVIPIVFIIGVPAEALAGRAGLASVLGALAVGGLSLVGSSLFWRFGLRFYSGASS
jgi:ABC-2 type transport system permease protein